jgi:carbon storage regulator
VLILSRRESESICFGDDIVLTIVAVGKDKVRIGVQAPPGVRILRSELEIDANAAGAALPFPQPERKPGPQVKVPPLRRRAA